ncbi:PREDICTED: protein DEHYDRATION-INDUCED 19 homolog 4-like [Brassica oleracea var. oleracea]|uniref:protein DEHYDRATION-INDUCED 19 homolog 4-like n=1 Tax=Brassica oleracea var. oleracea TaxID=109376 RepID=UPI0006A73D29|nr:PREDICTED: protein DEHYDRATION-INDUCED 19 homolog 4-like [Brassica oleracea var. oleracea]
MRVGLFFSLLSLYIAGYVRRLIRKTYDLTTQHANFFKVQRRTRLRKGGYSSAYLALKKELREANLQSLLGGSSRFTSPTNIDSDPLLSSFIFSSPSANEPPKKSATSVAEGTLAIKLSLKESLKREIQEAPLSGEDQQKAKKSEFVRGLLLSTILRDDLMMHA